MSDAPRISPGANLRFMAVLLAGGMVEPRKLVPKLMEDDERELTRAGLLTDASIPEVPAVRAVKAVAAKPAVPPKPAVEAKGKRPGKPSVPGKEAVEAKPAVPGRPRVSAVKRVAATAKGREAFVALLGRSMLSDPPKKEDAVVMAAILAKLHPLLERVGVGIEDIVKLKPDPVEASTGRSAPNHVDVKALVIAAYDKANNGSGIVRLKSMRPHLASVDRSLVDLALVRMHEGEGPLVVHREDDQRSLDDADREASLTYKGEAKHIVMRA